MWLASVVDLYLGPSIWKIHQFVRNEMVIADRNMTKLTIFAACIKFLQFGHGMATIDSLFPILDQLAPQIVLSQWNDDKYTQPSSPARRIILNYRVDES